MGEGSVTCSGCGAELGAGVRFCGKCGKPAPEAPAKASLPKKTMIAFEGTGATPPASPAPAPGAPASPAPASPAPASPAPASPVPAASASPSPAPASPAPAASAPAARGGAAAHAKTMMGLPPGMSLPTAPPGGGGDAGLGTTSLGVAPEAREQSSKPPAPAAAAPDEHGLGTTSLGVAPEQRQQQIKPGAGPPAVRGANTMIGLPSSGPPPATPAPAASDPPSTAVAAGRTMLGLPGTVPRPAPVPGAAKPAADIGGGRTMLGVGLSPTSDAPPPAATASSAYAADSDPAPALSASQTRDTEEATIPPSAGRGVALWVGVAAVVVLAIGVALWSRGGGESSVRAEVAREDGGEAMRFEVPGAPPGSKIRFGGQERELEAGRATFPLAADSLRVGDNAVIVDVVRPDGSVESARITLAVAFRIRVDLAPLKAGGSEVDVVASALAGSKVSIDGEALALDGSGKGVKRVKLDVAEGGDLGHVDHRIAYRVELPSGEVSVGEQVTRVPVTTMRIDRPGLELVTDRTSVEIGGAVEAGTTVTIDGADVPVSDERFLYELALPRVGEHNPVVVASIPGRVPFSRTLSIRRVEDLAEAAEGHEVDASLSYAKISQNPSIYKGQKAAFEGRIYAAKVQGGRSVLQMLVRECPKGRRCSLWITYPAATELTVDSWARVVGTLEGEQQFRSEADEVVTVPKIDAAFLLPAKP